jgi:hypothetical protein
MAQDWDDTKSTGHGNIFRNKNYTAGRPQFTGDVRLTRALLAELVDMFKKTGEAKMSITLWPKESEKAGRFYSVGVKRFVPYVKRGEEDLRGPVNPAPRRDPLPQYKAQAPADPLDDLNDDIPF